MSIWQRINGVFKKIVRAISRPFRRTSKAKTFVTAGATKPAPTKPAPTQPAPIKQTEFQKFQQKVKNYNHPNQLDPAAFGLMKDPAGFNDYLKEHQEQIPSFSADDVFQDLLKVPYEYRLALDRGNDYTDENGNIEHKRLLDEIYRVAGDSGSITWKVPGEPSYWQTMQITGEETVDIETLYSFTIHEIYSLMCDPRIGMKYIARQVFNS